MTNTDARRLPLSQALAIALDHHRAGRLDAAQALYHEILKVAPHHPDALHLLGTLAHQRGDSITALALLDGAIGKEATVAHYYANRGLVRRALKDYAGAMADLRQALALNPKSADAHYNLGLVFHDQGQFNEAQSCYQQALSLGFESAEIRTQVGHVLQARGEMIEALANYHRALMYVLDYEPAFRGLAQVLLRIEGQQANAQFALRHAERIAKGEVTEADMLAAFFLEQSKFLDSQGGRDLAIACLQRSLSLRPQWSDAAHNLGFLYHRNGQNDKALEAFQRAHMLNPRDIETIRWLAFTSHETGDDDKALRYFELALSIAPESPDVWNNLGIYRHERGQLNEAITAYENALRYNPNHAPAHQNFAATLLKLGDYARGWKEYEWRWKNTLNAADRRYPQPRWRGEALNGKTLLLWAEQGLGDTIQFVRYAQILARFGGRVVLECKPSLRRLLERAPGIHIVVATGSPLPPFDYHCPLLNVMQLVGTTIDTIPADVPYLLPAPETAIAWAAKLSGYDKYRIGLAWAGNPEHRKDRRRSIAISQLAPLLTMSDVTFFSLQVGSASAQLRSDEFARIVDMTGEIEDFEDTAALIASIDLVITVDTAVAHLAGAMHKPVWMLSRFDGCWRWLDQNITPWYPSMRIFRQPAPKDWATVISVVKEQLVSLVQTSLRAR